MRPIRRRWRLVLFIVAVGLLGAIAGTVLRGLTYSSSTTLQLPVAGSGSLSVTSDDIEFTERLINTYKQVADSEALKREVVMGVEPSGELELSFEPRPNTEFIDFTAQAGDAETAQGAADLATTILLDQVRNLPANQSASKSLDQQLRRVEGELVDLREARETRAGDESTKLDQKIRGLELRLQALADQRAALTLATDARQALSVVKPAGVGERETYLSHWREVLLVLVCSAALAGGLAILLERRSPMLDTPQQVQDALGAPVLGLVPWLPQAPESSLEGEAQRGHGEFRAMISGLLSRPESRSTVLAVASANNADGRSLIALQLAGGLARSGRATLLIDGDFYNPSLSTVANQLQAPGLSDALISGDDDTSHLPRDWVVSTDLPSLRLLPAGSSRVEAASELLASRKASNLLLGEKSRFDFIVIDAPPLRLSAILGSAAVDEVIFIVPALPARAASLSEARQALSTVNARFVGSIINRYGV